MGRRIATVHVHRVPQQRGDHDGSYRQRDNVTEACIERFVKIGSPHIQALFRAFCHLDGRRTARRLCSSQPRNRLIRLAISHAATHKQNRRPGERRSSFAGRLQFSMGCGARQRMVKFPLWGRSMPDPREFRLRNVLWLVLVTISVAAALRYALHTYGGIMGEDIRVSALLGAAALSAAVMATFLYRPHRH